MPITTTAVYEIQPVAEIHPSPSCTQIAFRNGLVGSLDAAHPGYRLMLVQAESSLRAGRPVGVVLDPLGRIADLNDAHDTAVRSLRDDPEDSNRLEVAFWGYSPICYLTRDHPEFGRLRSTLAEAEAAGTTVWVANHSQMVEGATEVWWKIMDVRPA
jgi:hypothetical protein